MIWDLAFIFEAIVSMGHPVCGSICKYIASDFKEKPTETLRNLSLVGALFVAIVGIWLAVWRNKSADKQLKEFTRQIEKSESGHNNERFLKAAEMLGSKELFTRIGGVSALVRLAREFPEKYHVEVTDLLCEFIRNSGLSRKKREASLPCPRDVEYAMQALGHRRDSLFDEGAIHVEKDYSLELEKFNLKELKLSNVDFSSYDENENYFAYGGLEYAVIENSKFKRVTFENVFLSHASIVISNFFKAMIVRSDLTDVTISGSYLSRAIFSDVNFTNATIKQYDYRDTIYYDRERKTKLSRSYIFSSNFTRARIENVELNKALIVDSKFTCAKISNSNFEGAILREVDFTKAELIDSNLRGTTLKNVDFSEAKLNNTNVEGVNFNGAKFRGAILTYIDFSGANLAGVDLKGATLAGSQLKDAIGLSQDMLKEAEPTAPPESLPEGLIWPFNIP